MARFGLVVAGSALRSAASLALASRNAFNRAVFSSSAAFAAWYSAMAVAASTSRWRRSAFLAESVFPLMRVHHSPIGLVRAVLFDRPSLDRDRPSRATGPHCRISVWPMTAADQHGQGRRQRPLWSPRVGSHAKPRFGGAFVLHRQ